MKLARVRTAGLLATALVAGILGIHPAPADPNPLAYIYGGPTDFVILSDGTSIAVTVIYPDGYETNPNKVYDPATPGSGYPAILEMAGYENGSVNKDGRTTLGQLEDWGRDNGYTGAGPPLANDSHGGTSAIRYDEYVVVHAQMRGTGCSSGEFDLFSSQNALDGYEIIESWIVDQDWSNQKVGIIGHSFSGMTGFMVASAEGWAKRNGKPNHLVATSVSGLIDDLYRGLVYPGGVANALFPPLWTLAIRPAYDLLGGRAQGIVRNYNNPMIAATCAENIAKQSRSVLNDPVLHGTSDSDTDWWRARSMVGYAPNIAHPIHITGAFQDEQTGPRFPHLWETIPSDTSKRLLMTNGSHGTQLGIDETWMDRKAWMDQWMEVSTSDNPYVPNPDNRLTSVRTLLELQRDTNDIDVDQNTSEMIVGGILDRTSFPLEDTTWTDYYLCGDKTLSTSTTGCSVGSNSYLSGSKRQLWSYDADGYVGDYFGEGIGSPFTTSEGPDEIAYVGPTLGPTADPVAIAGPILARLYLSSTAPDTDLFVQVVDEDTVEGTVSFLQRGMLRSAHRPIVDGLSDKTPAGFMYRPFRRHEALTLLEPMMPEEHVVEIFPVAHVLRPGHRLRIKVMGTPAVDSEYGYPSKSPPALNTVLSMDPGFPSRITLPVVTLTDFDGNAITVPTSAPACGSYHQVRCVEA